MPRNLLSLAAFTLLGCSLAVPAVPPSTPVVRPPTQPPQTIVQSAQAAAKEVLVAGRSLGFYNVGPLTPQPVIMTSQGTLNAVQAAFWSSWYKSVVDRVPAPGKDVIIIARSLDGREVQRWTLQGAWPTKFSYAIAAAGSAQTASVSLVYTSVVSSL